MIDYLLYLRFLLDNNTGSTVLFLNKRKYALSLLFLKLVIKTILCNDKLFLSNIYICCNNCDSCLLFTKKLHKDLYFFNFFILYKIKRKLGMLQSKLFTSRYKVVVIYNINKVNSIFLKKMLRYFSFFTKVFFIVVYDMFNFRMTGNAIEFKSKCNIPCSLKSFNLIKPYYFTNHVLFSMLYIFLYNMLYKSNLVNIKCGELFRFNLCFLKKPVFKSIFFFYIAN